MKTNTIILKVILINLHAIKVLLVEVEKPVLKILQNACLQYQENPIMI